MNTSSAMCRAVVLVVAAVSLAAASGRTEKPLLDSHTFGAIVPRAIGPAVMSGRIAAIAVAPTKPQTVWVGSASGGVWRSTNGGTTFDPVFDDHTASIGAISVDPNDPDTVWVGTGESWVRNSVSVGSGVYRTTDGGETWQLMGLEDCERVARILVNPVDSSTVFVAAVGHLWNGNAERGVFRTRDGGATWDRVLFVDEDTGCADLAMDPQKPEIVYAALWQLRREPHRFTSGGPGSGLFRSDDGGDTWFRLSQGLPEGDLGRMGIAVAPTRPNRVYAVVEAGESESGLYRSDDLGATWSRVNHSHGVVARPFYFASLTVDPENPDLLYKPGFGFNVSNDGGETFSGGILNLIGGGVHPDLHAVWVDPGDPWHLLVGTDGGLYESRDRGRHFTFVGALPVAQFYHVSADNEHPYNVYGGLQDNGSWMGPSRAIGGIKSFHWRTMGRGDGFWVLPDPELPSTVYLESQGGNMVRVNRSSGETKDIKPRPAAGEPDYRFNWNTPIQLGRHRPGTLYAGSQFLHKSRDRGESWQRLSPDLTTDAPDKQRQESSGGLTIDNSSAENHCSIYTISESPLDESVIWVGTDDGNLQRTSDGGDTWANVVENVPGLAAGAWVSWVEASPHDTATAYVTFDDHRRGDMRPQLYVTHDLGATWQALADDVVRGYCHVIRQDPVEPDLLFVGTEFGLYVSIDAGANWVELEGGFPNVAVRDLVIHPREHDLIIATHGRGIWILDDLTPIRNLTAEVMAAEAALVPSRPSVLSIPSSEQRWEGDSVFVGTSPVDTATITYHLSRRHLFGDMRVEVRSVDGTLVATLPGTKRRGINRIEWAMRSQPPVSPHAGALVTNPYAYLGPRLPEGTYTVTLVKGTKTFKGAIELVPDPRSPHSPEDRMVQHDTVRQLYAMLERTAAMSDDIAATATALWERAEVLPQRRRLAAQIENLAEELDSLHQDLVAPAEGGLVGSKERLRERLSVLYGNINGFEGRPSRSQLDRAAVLGDELSRAETTWMSLRERVEEINRELTVLGLAPGTASNDKEAAR